MPTAVPDEAPWRGEMPRVFTIPPQAAFLDCLAAEMLRHAGDDPLRLAAITVLLPTRRACRSLREAFLRLTGKPLLLPRLFPLNDLDEEEAAFSGFAAGDATAQIPPPIAPLKRELLLARLIGGLRTAGETPSPEQAILLAQELARFLDRMQTERINFDRLRALVPDDYARHWQITLEFLAMLTEHWPGILAAEGCVDPAHHRNLVFAAQMSAWRNGATKGPIIAAGSTGSIPATADLLAMIARLPEGCVVLPGLDRDLDDAAWEAVDDVHPQSGLKQLLAHMDVTRAAVRLWPTLPTDEVGAARARLISAALRPAAGSASTPIACAAAIDGLTRIDAPGPREEAEIIALIMRESLETPGRTCALITPDRKLAARVTTELSRWDIDIDDSGGRSLGQTPPGAFLRLLATMVAQGFSPVATLAVCKHPLSAGGLDPITFRHLSRTAEIVLLRGPRPPEGLDGLGRLAETATTDRPALSRWLNCLTETCGAFAALLGQEQSSLPALLAAHLDAAEKLVASDEMPGPLRLWAGEAGEALAAFAAELMQNAGVMDAIPPRNYPAVFETLMNGRVVRPRFGRHPRLAILGPLEARLQRFDVTILGSLNEGTWPAEPAADPWMSRPMRAALGLPPPEQRIALAAHDVAQALCGPRLYLTRASKVDGTLTVPSRWLRRLDLVVDASKGVSHAELTRRAETWLSWAIDLCHPGTSKPSAPPAPRPPLAARPRKLSVTEIERWRRDPYDIYAKHVLGLLPLDPLEQEASAADYGTLVHRALQSFIARHPTGLLPDDAGLELLAIGRDLFAKEALRPAVTAFWWPRFERIAVWFLNKEQSRRPLLARAYVECAGALTLAGPAGPFTLTARADRIDCTQRNRLVIIDYKTGAPPDDKQVYAGYAPQLPLEAAIAAAGGFGDLPTTVEELSYWQLHGRKGGGEARTVSGDARALGDAARAGLERLIAAFDDPATGYEAQPNPDYAPTYSNYFHLARVKEWAAASEDDV